MYNTSAYIYSHLHTFVLFYLIHLSVLLYFFILIVYFERSVSIFLEFCSLYLSTYLALTLCLLLFLFIHSFMPNGHKQMMSFLKLNLHKVFPHRGVFPRPLLHLTCSRGPVLCLIVQKALRCL